MGQRGEHAQLEEGPRGAGEKIFKAFFCRSLTKCGKWWSSIFRRVVGDLEIESVIPRLSK